MQLGERGKEVLRFPQNLAFFGLLTILIGVASGYRQPFLDESSPPQHRPLEQAIGEFVSSKACRSCHPGQYDSWHASWHRTMTQVASSHTVAIPLDGVAVTIASDIYRFSVTNDEVWVEFRDPDNYVPDDGPWIRRQIVMTTGSHHFQAFWYAAGDGDRSLRMLDAAYVIDSDRWMSIASVFLKPPDPMPGVNGLWNASCILCHTTRGNPKLESGKGFDSQAVEFGIACESCHGPGSEHIQARRFPVSRYGMHWGDEPDPTIVNPRRLDPERQSLVCGQCHAVFNPKSDADFKTWKTSGTSFAAGDAELPLRDVSFEGEQYFWPDGHVRVTGREYNDQVTSPCFLHGDPDRGIMTCLACHSMHKEHGDTRPAKTWANRQLKVGMEGKLACTQCHGGLESAESIEAHTHHAPAAAASECVNCHMPHTTWGQQRAIRSHAITTPDVATAQATGRPDACSLCHLDKTYAWTASHLERWYQQEIPVLSEDERHVAVGPLLAIRGDAGQRALMAWSFGWKEAQEAAGTWWMPPYLGVLMQDPYDVIRYRGHRSLLTLPGYENLGYEFDDDPRMRASALRGLKQVWERSSAIPARDLPELLIRGGTIATAPFQELLGRRNNRVVYLQE